MPMQTQMPINIQGHVQRQLSVSAVGAQTPALRVGVYDCWCDVDVYIKVADNLAASPDRAQDVTTSSGYLITAGNTVPVFVAEGAAIGAIAGGAGTLRFHRVA